jgi:hypothetical protein
MSPGRNENKWNAHLLIAFHPKAQIIMDIRQVSWLSTLLTPSRGAECATVATMVNNVYVDYSCGDSSGISPYSLLIF